MEGIWSAAAYCSSAVVSGASAATPVVSSAASAASLFVVSGASTVAPVVGDALSTKAAEALGYVVGGAGTAVAATAGGQAAVGLTIAPLMQAGATVVAGVGSIMPWWIAPIQVVAMTPVAPYAAGLGAAAGLAYYVGTLSQ